MKTNTFNVLFHKETADFIKSKKMTLLAVIISIITVSGLYAAVSGVADALKNQTISNSFIFLKLYTASANSIPSYTALMALMGPFIGIFMGFDEINSERSEGTLNRLVSQPIYRDQIIISKFLAGLFLIGTTVFSSGLFIGSVGILTTGLVPGGEEIGRLILYLFFCVVYIGFWLAVSILFSTVCRHAATSALSCIALWLFCAIFISLLAGIISELIFPVSGNNMNAVLNALDNARLKTGINRLSPYYLFGEAGTTLMNPATRTVNAVTMQQLEGALSGNLPLSQSILLVWPHLTALIALMLVTFAISYVSFMKQEIRSR